MFAVEQMNQGEISFLGLFPFENSARGFVLMWPKLARVRKLEREEVGAYLNCFDDYGLSYREKVEGFGEVL